MEENAQAWLNFIFLLLKWNGNILLEAGVVTRDVRYSIYERAWNMLHLGSGVLNTSSNQLQNLGVVQFLFWNPDILRSSIFWELAIWIFRRHLKRNKDLTKRDKISCFRNMDYKRVGPKCDRVSFADRSAENAEWTRVYRWWGWKCCEKKKMCGHKDEIDCLQLEFTVFKHMMLFLTFRNKHVS